PQEEAGKAFGALAAHGVLLGRLVDQRCQDPSQVAIALGSRTGAVVQGLGEGLWRGTLLHPRTLGQRNEERIRARQPLGLGDSRFHLPPRGDVPAPSAEAQGLHISLDRFRDGVHPGGDIAPMLFGFGGHHVEDFADELQWGSNHVQLAQVLPGLVQLQFQAEAFAHGQLRDPVHLVGGLHALQSGQDFLGSLGLGSECGGGEVVQGGLVTGEAHLRGADGGEAGQRGDVLLGERVGGGGGASVLSHGVRLSPLAMRRAQRGVWPRVPSATLGLAPACRAQRWVPVAGVETYPRLPSRPWLGRRAAGESAGQYGRALQRHVSPPGRGPRPSRRPWSCQAAAAPRPTTAESVAPFPSAARAATMPATSAASSASSGVPLTTRTRSEGISPTPEYSLGALTAARSRA